MQDIKETECNSSEVNCAGKKTAVTKFIKNRKRCVILIVLALLLAGMAYGNLSLQITTYEIGLSEEYAGMDGFTIVQVSDLHNARFGKEQSRLLQAVEEQEPDIIVITGDLVDSSHTDVDVAMEFAKQAVTIAPVYYVTGNHEGWLGATYGELEAQMEQAGVIILSDTMYTQMYGDTTYSIAGVRDPDMPGNNIVKTEDVVGVLVEDAEGYTILLSHRPELFDTYTASNANLVFAGHYHGGQFRIPFIGGVYAPGAGFFPEYTEGVFTENDTTMVVSRGLGNSVIPVRINNRPEVVVVRLMAEIE